MTFTYVIKQTKKKEDYIEITGITNEAKRIVIPDEIQGIPVKGIGSSAFARNKNLEEAVLCDGIYSLGRYAFYHCTNLRKLILSDGIEDYYDGVTKLCEQLSHVEINLERENYTVIKELLGDNDRTLQFTIRGENFGGMKEIKLTFPAYYYDFVEDVEARVLHHKIEGAGYPYRECVSRKGIDFRAYDQLFYQAITDDWKVAAEIALCRLQYPYELEKEAKSRYEAFILQQSEKLIVDLISDKRIDELDFIVREAFLTKEACQLAVDYSVEHKLAEYTAMFLEYDKKHFHRNDAATMAQGDLSLELEDW